MAKNIIARIRDRALDKAYASAMAFCTSRQLRRSMFKQQLNTMEDTASGEVGVPQYWAVYKHSGRGPLNYTHRKASYFVWFRNPKDDPRMRNGISPVTRGEIRHLTPADWEKWAKRNAEAKAIGEDPPMIVKKAVGGMTVEKQNPFFSDQPGGGLASLGADVTGICAEEAHTHVEAFLRESGLKKKHIKRYF